MIRMTIRTEVQQLINDTLSVLEIEHDGEITVDYPADLSMGDFASPIAMKLGKQLGQNPKELADRIVAELSYKLPDSINSVAVAGPGFVNFTLSGQYWTELKKSILESGDQWGNNESLLGQTYLIEHSSPNMFKPFHVGHLVNNFVGASINQIVAANGAETHVVSFPSDVSPGIAKAVWGLMDLGMADDFTIEQVGEAYAHGSQQYKENDEVKESIDEINLKLYRGEEGPELEVFQKGLTMSYDYFENITVRLGSDFEQYFPESECEVEGKQIVQKNTPEVFVESQGAVIFEGSKHGLFDNVFVNSQGFGTYLCKDIGLLSLKFLRYNFDQSVTITDIEQKQHFQLVKKAAEQINQEWSDKSTYIQHGRLALTSGKISSRDGGVPLALDLLETVRGKVLEKMKERNIENPDQVAEQVAQAALKYSILKTAAGKNIIFDFEKDLSFEGTSGPYIQYAYVRAVNAVKQAEELLQGNESRERTGDTPDLERMLVRFPDVVRRALDDYSPHHIAGHVYELAQEFNSFYAQTKIADADNPDIAANVTLVRSVAQTLQNGLYLLGIETVEEM